MQKRLEIELTVLERQDLTYCLNVLGSRLWQSLFFSKSRLCQHLFLLWRNWRALLFITLPHKEVRSWTTFCFFTHNQLLSISRFFQLCVYFAVFLCIASPSALVRGSQRHLSSFPWQSHWWCSQQRTLLSKQPSWKNETGRAYLARVRSVSFLWELDVSSTVTSTVCHSIIIVHSFHLAFRFPTGRTSMWGLLDFTLPCLWLAE